MTVETEGGLRLGSPQVVFERRPTGQGISFGRPESFDVAPDGDRFLLRMMPDGLPDTHVILHWTP